MTYHDRCPAPASLRQRFGRTYRIAYDEAWKHERGKPWASEEEPFLQIILCRQGGHIYPHGDGLAFADKDGGQLGRKVAKLPGTTKLQDGDDGMNVGFPLEMFDQVARIVHPRRRRRGRPGSAEHLRAHWFKSAVPETARTGLGRVPSN